MNKLHNVPKFLPDIMLSHVAHQPQAIAYMAIDRKNNSRSMTYTELHQNASKVANILIEKNLVKENIILLYPNSLDFIVMFLACLYSKAIAIPINFDKSQAHQSLAFIQKISEETKAKAIATIDNIALLLRETSFVKEQKIDIIILDLEPNHEAYTFVKSSIFSNDISHIQYTSGSTSNPKGSICTHQNLSTSLFETSNAWGYTSKSITVCWAPHTHVYGLTTGLLVPLYSGSQAILISRQDFLMNPFFWLDTISRFKATHSGSPNFGYEYCVEYIEQEDLEKLELSSWQVATNGGESVRLTTLMEFYKKFKGSGFKWKSFYPAYGMSECTGLISTQKMNDPPSFCYVDKEALKHNHIISFENSLETDDTRAKTQALVSCGFPINGLILKIIDPKTKQEVSQNHIGEIWLKGPMCSPGFWNISNSSLDYIKTGDLGFMNQQGLFLVGRLKELIIIYGKNFYPIDIEMDIKNTDRKFLKYSCMTFSDCIDDNEELFVLQEIQDNLSEQEYHKLAQLIRKTIAHYHGIDTYGIVFVAPSSIVKTTNGKIKRNITKQKYFDQKIRILYESLKTTV